MGVNIMLNRPKVLDIFCGAGGMSEGFIKAGFDVCFASDINETAMLTYMNRHNQLGFKTKFACEDIRKFSEKKYLNNFLEGTTIDVVCGGPPCQGFSLAGKRDRNDPRNMLFKNYIKVIRNVKPKYFVMENVEGILSMRFEEFIGINNNVYINESVADILRQEFFQIGYLVNFKVLQASDFGVPQNRRRVFFLGHKIKKLGSGKYKNMVSQPNFPNRNAEPYITAKEAIHDLSFLDSGHKSSKYKQVDNLTQYQKECIKGRTPTSNGGAIESKELMNHESSKHCKKVLDRFSLIKEGENLEDLRKKLGNEKWKEYETKKMRCQRIIGSEPSPTVLTLPDDLIHYSKDRIMTVREFARLQSFDDSFQFLGKRTTGGKRRKFDLPQNTQVGNAVPPLMAKAVAQEILLALKNS